MADSAANLTPIRKSTRPSFGSIALPPLFLCVWSFLAAGPITISLRPLRALQIEYPGWLDSSYWLIPAACAALWLISLFRWPDAGAILAVLTCVILLSLIPWYADGRVVRVPVTRWLSSNELQAIESALGVPVFEQGSRAETFVIVAPENEPRVRAELARLQLLGGSAGQ